MQRRLSVSNRRIRSTCGFHSRGSSRFFLDCSNL